MMTLMPGVCKAMGDLAMAIKIAAAVMLLAGISFLMSMYINRCIAKELRSLSSDLKSAFDRNTLRILEEQKKHGHWLMEINRSQVPKESQRQLE